MSDEKNSIVVLPKMMTATELSEITLLSEHVKKKLCKTNKIASFNMGGKCFINVNFLAEYLSKPNE